MLTISWRHSTKCPHISRTYRRLFAPSSPVPAGTWQDVDSPGVVCVWVPRRDVATRKLGRSLVSKVMLF